MGSSSGPPTHHRRLRFSFSLGLPFASKSELSTSNSSHVLSSSAAAPAEVGPAPPVLPLHPLPRGAAPPEPPSLLRRRRAGEFVSRHGASPSGPSALSVADAAPRPRSTSVANGAVPALRPTRLGRGFRLAERSALRRDVVLRFVSGSDASVDFLPGFEDVRTISDIDYGLRELDHAVGQRHSIAPVVSYMKKFLGFHEFAEFTASDVGTADSGLNSSVLANNEETVLLPLNEPVHGTKRRSQIQTYLDHHGGPGVQHLALRSDDVIATVRKMKGVSGFGGFEFMEGPPPNYYEGVKRRAGDVLSEEQIRECQELGLLVDRDDQGVLVQIFTKPIGDRPTIFLEIIQRIGCMRKDDQGKEYQKGGCGGFGKGNFSELFKCIEEYEKTLEAKQQPTTVSA
ncbi:LOW QUALITY PROTEIN: 4-hydroxyphenylpyruvate dioxygenase-like [Asparagus officinalis]|uniref:LOW QUALITY PROTEIN: 4-hydroxyphenylpyruvate dioxygenase-like n=1 Tax=Asparagus officinalis TaxID=4686 RepID=UPI00098E7A68|nr:LOW QUALITY PROTEIN: 4-hydroxyphenylpyruvate dioxygenase-like [Asparagus officinalis]